MRTLPDFSYETACRDLGYSSVIGVDEVGRGSLAGPVVAGATLLKTKDLSQRLIGPWPKRQKTILALGIDDSKRLPSLRRETLAPLIKQYFHWAIGQASVAEINRLGIVRATRVAMRRAINSLWSRVCSPQSENSHWITKDLSHRLIGPWPKRQKTKDNAIVLVDGSSPIPRIGMKQRAIIKGDQKSISIAAASVIAKVYRDALMCRLAAQFPAYTWHTNKGYGTSRHCQAISLYGPTVLHRRDFLPLSASAKFDLVWA